MEIKSSLLNSNEFKFVKKSLVNISEIDNKAKERVRIIEYINDTSDDSGDMFFYDMLEFTRFLKPNSKHIAYTTPDCLIYLNAPGKVGPEPKKWDFIYDHECLHQLWETFKVEDKIKEEKGSCDHKVLNWASDCVINDYLKFYRKKPYPTNDLITPEYLEEKYKIKYDRNKDTQYTLYLKLLEKKDEMKDDDRMNQNNENQENQENQEGDNDSQDSQDNNQDNQSSNSNQNKESNKSDSDKEGKESKGQGSEGEGENKEGNKDEKSSGSGKGHGDQKGDEIQETPQDLKKIKEKAKETIEKYRQRITGDLGKFLAKCKSSVKVEDSGLGESVQQGKGSWNKQMNNAINAYVKKKVFQKKREYERTYTRLKRGSGFIEYGKPIEAGRRIKQNKFPINVAFYVDRSGSMGSCIEHCFDALYTIAESLKKQFSKESVVDKVEFSIFAFDTELKKIKYGNRANANGGTMSFHSLLENIKKETQDYLINVIITDADFSVNKPEVEKFLKEIHGMLLFITNNDNRDVKSIADKHKEQLVYVLADSQFKIK